jgi:glycosyltransferase involved in cell wall biosynthesis
MIDILYLIYPPMIGLMTKVNGTTIGKHPFYENAMVRAECDPTWKDIEDEWTADRWIEGLKKGGKRLYLSVCITGDHDKPAWCGSMGWVDVVAELVVRSRKVIMIEQSRENFLYDRIRVSDGNEDAYDELAMWWADMKNASDSVALINPKKIRRINLDMMHEKKTVERINRYVDVNIVPPQPIIRNDKDVWEKVKKTIGRIGTKVGVREREVGSCNVLSIIGRSMATWADYRGNEIKKVLSKNSIEHEWMYESPHQVLKNNIESCGCKLVINEAFCVQPDTIRRLAEEFPHINFVNLNHFSPSSMPEIFAMQSLGLRLDHIAQYDWLAYSCPNVYTGTVMDEDRFSFSKVKIASLPNPCRVIEDGLERVPNPNMLSLSLVCRFSYLKNIPAQINAVCKVAQERPTSLIMVTNYNRIAEMFSKQMKLSGVTVKLVQWGNWRQLMAMLGLYVDIGLQVSLSESLNMVALEHMMLGKPVVGCDALEYLPPEWKANPQNPKEIADVILDHAENLEERKYIAKGIAYDVITQDNDKFIEGIKKLL